MLNYVCTSPYASIEIREKSKGIYFFELNCGSLRILILIGNGIKSLLFHFLYEFNEFKLLVLVVEKMFCYFKINGHPGILILLILLHVVLF
jgi:hypothetical protein